MRNLKTMNDEELKYYWKACMSVLSNKPYTSMDGNTLEETDVYAAAMCMQHEFTKRGDLMKGKK